MTAPIALVTGKTDTECAKEIRGKIEQALEPVCRVLDEAVSAGFTVQFALSPDYRGRNIISVLKIVKEF